MKKITKKKKNDEIKQKGDAILRAFVVQLKVWKKMGMTLDNVIDTLERALK